MDKTILDQVIRKQAEDRFHTMGYSKVKIEVSE